MRSMLLTIFATLALTGTALAKVDLTTLPPRGKVQLTIYNSADLTLVRETRRLTLQPGLNRLEFGWANTSIDPTSLTLSSREKPGAVELVDVSFPPRTRETSVWTVRSEVSGEVEVEIQYFTSGLSWQATYDGTLGPDQSTMDLLGYVRVTNQSGEDYPDAQVRVIVGTIHAVDAIIDLARQQYPYGVPVGAIVSQMRPGPAGEMRQRLEEAVWEAERAASADAAPDYRHGQPKQVVKEGLSEYFLYTIEGTETIEHGWAKRLRSLDVRGIPVVNLYKYEEERWRNATHRFLFFANDKAHKLGDSPLPDGPVKVFRRLSKDGHLSFVGSATSKYIPVDQVVELDLGPVDLARATATVMDYKTENYVFDGGGNVSGFDELKTWGLRLQNLQDIPARIQVSRNFGNTYWNMDERRFDGTYEKEDIDTATFTVELGPFSEHTIHYVVRHYHGWRQDRR